MTTDIAARFAPARLSPALARSPLLRSLRLWVRMARDQRNPRSALSVLLGGRAAASFGVLMEMAVGAWGDAFIVFTPCAERLSVDESTLLLLLDAAEREDAASAHALLAEMMPPADRERLIAAAWRVMDELTPTL